MGREELCLSVALPLLLMISERARAQCTFPSFESKNVVPSGSQSLTGNFSDGSTLTFECMVGHRPINSRASKRVTCDKNQWTDLQLECKRKSCGSLPDFQYGHYEMEGILFGDKVTAVCDKGYMLDGQIKDRWCRSNGWDGRDPICESVKCEAPPPIENGQLENEPFSSYSYLEAVSYTCNHDFNLIGSSTLHCSEDGTFKPDPPTCFGGCPKPEVPNAVRTEGRSPPYKLNNFIGYKCADDYTMKGQNRIVCTENGWSPEVPRCIAPCSRPDFGGNVILTEEFRSRRSFPHGLTVTFKCIGGHEPVDSSVSKSSTCEETKWTELLFTCKAVKCEAPPPIDNGQLENEPFSSYTYSDNVSYTCNHGFDIFGSSTLQCSEDKTFKPNPPKCLARCSRPVFGGNVILTEEFRSQQSFQHGSTVTFECIGGHEPVDLTMSRSSTCKEAKWTELFFTCKAVSAPVSVSVTDDDSVTLNINDPITQKADELLWKTENKLIAKFDRETNELTISDTERLQMDKKTGSLTINNIKITDSGLYQLQIKIRGIFITKRFNVVVQDKVTSLSVMEGDTVTIKTGVTGILSARLNSPDGKRINTDLNHEIGEITIRKIQTVRSGVYKLEINSNSMILLREYSITVGKMKTVSVMEGKPIILYTGLNKIQGQYLILWKFEDHLIAEINKETNQFLTDDSSTGGRFNRRQQLNRQSGDLTISDSRSTDSGVYHLQMSSSSHTVQRNISVTVSAVPDSCEVAGIVVLLAVFAAAAAAAAVVGCFLYCRRKMGVIKVIVKEGDLVTLDTGVTKLHKGHKIQWLYGDSRIAQITGEEGKTHDGDDERFFGKLTLDKKTGNLNISDIKTILSGLYKLKITRNKWTTHKRFNLIVNLKTVQVNVRDSVTLPVPSEAKLQEDDLILWKFGPQGSVIAKFDRETKKITTYDDPDGIFSAGLNLDDETGSLTIRNVKPKHAGLYKLQLSNRKRTSNWKYKVKVTEKRRNDYATSEKSLLNGDDLDIMNEHSV